MELVQTVVRNVGVLVLVTLFLQLLLPSGKLAGFVRMMMGLLLLATLLNPVLEFLGGTPSLPVYNSANTQSQTQRILQRGEELAAGWQEAAGQEYLEGLSQQMTAVVLLLPGTSQAQVQLTLDEQGQISDGLVTVQYNGEEDANMVRERLSSSLRQYFGLPEGTLTIMVQSGGQAVPTSEG